ncbi:NUDIX hydrolase [Kocuria soli]|uniref:NUDIX hydrolase n=1 Tax=Kocuria soli TaxID=2485125 RepID=A0A3N3ZWA0_9MICC|nr:NUDIX domain-containing protein [Kocuria soli]ROZ64676.1 NUDIX hydrolase [Kocuria soli]
MAAQDFYGSVSLAVSTVIFALKDRALWVPLVRREREPYKGTWALPGGPLSPGRNLPDSALSTLEATTGLTPSYLEQLYAWGNPERSGGDGHVVSVVYWAALSSTPDQEAKGVAWFPVDGLPSLAFDHAEILDYAVARLRRKVAYSRIAHSFMPETFTLTELREAHEAIVGHPLDPANFARQFRSSPALIDTGRHREGTPFRPPRLYRYDSSLTYADDGALARASSAPDDTQDPTC